MGNGESKSSKNDKREELVAAPVKAFREAPRAHCCLGWNVGITEINDIKKHRYGKGGKGVRV